MKLLYCIPALNNAGGMERVITEKTNFLANLPNYKIIIVTTDQLNLPIYFQLDYRIQVVHLDVDFNRNFTANLLKKYISYKQKLKIYRKKLIALLEEHKVDICISLCGKEIEFLNKLPVNCKKIVEIHFAMNFRKQFLTSRHKGFFWSLLGEIRTTQLINSVKDLDKLILLTVADKVQWERRFTNVIQIPNPNPLENHIVSTLDSKQVISVGKLDAQKGYDMLVEAWAIVSSKHPDWILNIYGSGEWKQILTNEIAELNLCGKVNLCGITDNVVSNYLESSIYVMSSRYEGLPMVLIEAMSCGLPIVSFDCEHGPRDIIDDAVNGFLVEPNNIKSLASKICILIENEQLRKEVGHNSFEKSRLYSKEKIMPQWISLFEELIKK